MAVKRLMQVLYSKCRRGIARGLVFTRNSVVWSYRSFLTRFWTKWALFFFWIFKIPGLFTWAVTIAAALLFRERMHGSAVTVEWLPRNFLRCSFYHEVPHRSGSVILSFGSGVATGTSNS